MRRWVADYEILAPLGSDDRPEAFLARPPRRLPASGQVTVHLLGRRPHPLAHSHLKAFAAAGVPGAVKVLEIGREQEAPPGDDGHGGWYVATEYCDGGSLAERAGADGRAALPHLEAAARAAHALHEKGVAHGDIRPETVLLRSGEAVLAAPAGPARLEAGQTALAGSPGRLATMDPAVLRGESPSRASDLWSLGVTAHFVLTGRWAHPGIDDDDPLTAVQRVLFDPPVMDTDLSDGEVAVLGRCLSRDPGARHPSAAALADDLRMLAGER